MTLLVCLFIFLIQTLIVTAVSHTQDQALPTLEPPPPREYITSIQRGMPVAEKRFMVLVIVGAIFIPIGLLIYFITGSDKSFAMMLMTLLIPFIVKAAELVPLQEI
jgi:hypothetical protein